MLTERLLGGQLGKHVQGGVNPQPLLAEHVGRIITGQLAAHQINERREGVQRRRAARHHFQIPFAETPVFLIAQRALFQGHFEHRVTARQGAFRVTARVVVAGALQQGHQGGELVGLQFFQGPPEIKLGAQPHAVDGALAVLAQVHLVEVGLENLLFAVVQLQQHRHRHFHQLAGQGAVLREPEVLHQLLGQGAAALHQATCFHIGHHGAGQPPWRDPVMLIEITILGGQQHLHQQRRHTVQRHEHPVLGVTGVDAADLQRLQPGQRIAVVAAQRTDPSATERDANTLGRLAAVAVAETTGMYHQRIAVGGVAARRGRTAGATVTHQLQHLEHVVAGQNPARIQLHRSRVNARRQLPDVAVEPVAHISIQVGQPGGRQHQHHHR